MFVLVFALGARLEIDTDVWWHLRAGAETLHSGVIHNDTFSFTKAGAAWIDHSWGSEVIMQLAWAGAGYGGLELLAGALALCGGVFLFLMSSGGVYLRALAVALASLTASIFWTPRPQMFSYALTAAVLYVLYLQRRRRVDVVWLLPLLLLAWANLHGGFALGLLVILLTLAGEGLEQLLPLDDRDRLSPQALRRLGVACAASLLAVCINPYGPRLLRVPFATASGSFTNGLEEWKAPNFDRPGFWPFAFMLALLVVSLGVSRRRAGWSDMLLCAAATILALDAGRNVSTFAVVVTPVLTYHLAAALDDRGWVVRTARSASMRVAALNLIVLVGVFAAGLVVIAQPFSKSRLARAEQSTLPVGAVAYMRSAHVTGRLFNDYGFGGYLVHELPSAPVFVDGRSDLYGGRFLDEYQRIAAAAPGWDEQLRRARVRTAVVARGSGIDAALRARSDEWRLRYQDGLAAVFTRRPRFAA